MPKSKDARPGGSGTGAVSASIGGHGESSKCSSLRRGLDNILGARAELRLLRLHTRLGREQPVCSGRPGEATIKLVGVAVPWRWNFSPRADGPFLGRLEHGEPALRLCRGNGQPFRTADIPSSGVRRQTRAT
jgi:hypothetical protein